MQRTLSHFPKKHIHLVILFSLVGTAILMLLPSPNVSATKHSRIVSMQTELENPDTPTTIETSALPQKPNQNSLIPQQSTISSPPAKREIKWQTNEIKEGDSLSTLFAKFELPATELHAVVHSNALGKLLTNIHPGQNISFDIGKNNNFRQLRYAISPTETLLVSKSTDETYQYEKQVRTYEERTRHAQAVIEHSLFVDAKKAGMSENLIMELANLFGWDIDFALDIRSGDSFDVVYEELFLDGKKQKNGKILAANFFNQGRRFTAIYYEKPGSAGAYYTENGASVRKEFTRTPVDFARISSHFNLKRKHPVLHKIRAHKGVDYAASRGTPIKATGDGKVILVGRKGGYGKTVIIQHGQRYTTLYAHLNGYAKGLRSGKRVRQGQVIGYVGSTGMATGPHLHYEFRVNGVHRNPLTVKLPRANPLQGEEKQRFFAQTADLRQQLLALTSQRTLAMNEF